MKNSLKTLGRIQKFQIDEQRKRLVEQQKIEDHLNRTIKELDDSFEKEKAFAKQNANIGDFGLYVKTYLKKKEELLNRLHAVEQKIAEIRDIIADLFKEQKTYEIVDERRRKAAQKELEDKEQKMLDEIGTNAYIKKHEQQD